MGNSHGGRFSTSSNSSSHHRIHRADPAVPFPTNPTLPPPPPYVYPPYPRPDPHPPPPPPPPHRTPQLTPMAVSLPYSHVDSCLRALAGQAEGFGRFAIGGLNGPVHHVTTLADDGPGSLREACRKQEPLWIVFETSGTIHLSSFLNVSSYKTIDGRGQRIKLTGKGLRLKECEHVIICNLEFEGGRGHDVDGIQIKPNSKHLWIDRCTLRDYDDGLIDITRGSTDITVSRCHFSQHDKTMLIGADPSHIGDRCIRVTIHHCFFDGSRQRHPELDLGKYICIIITLEIGASMLFVLA
ncbi:hypothetical protein Dimus_007272 [Dionaea muscipula]